MRREPEPAPLPQDDRGWAPARCARCGRAFRCGADAPSCWCDAVRLSPDQRARLARLGLRGCLCRACLEAL